MSSSNNITSAIDNERSKAAFLFREAIYPEVYIEMELKQIMASTTSDFQQVSVIETSFGKTLVTDGKTQSSQVDEHVYHESLVHPSLIRIGLENHGNSYSSSIQTTETSSKEEEVGPKRVFIGGGGELATAREVLRHKSVKEIVMVDIDEVVLEVCKKYLPEWGGEGVASNPRLNLIIGDAYQYLLNCQDKFDVIIMDISDPIEAGPGIMLYTKEFYQHTKTLLNDNGVFVTQAGTAEPINMQNVEPGCDEDMTCLVPITNTLNEVFDCVLPYSSNIPSFGCDWGFVMAFDSSQAQKHVDELVNLNIKTIDEAISSRIGRIDGFDSETNDESVTGGNDILKFYDGESHRRMFSIPKPLRMKLRMDKRIMTRDNPVFMY